MHQCNVNTFLFQAEVADGEIKKQKTENGDANGAADTENGAGEHAEEVDEEEEEGDEEEDLDEEDEELDGEEGEEDLDEEAEGEEGEGEIFSYIKHFSEQRKFADSRASENGSTKIHQA